LCQHLSWGYVFTVCLQVIRDPPPARPPPPPPPPPVSSTLNIIYTVYILSNIVIIIFIFYIYMVYSGTCSRTRGYVSGHTFPLVVEFVQTMCSPRLVLCRSRRRRCCPDTAGPRWTPPTTAAAEPGASNAWRSVQLASHLTLSIHEHDSDNPRCDLKAR